MTNTEEGYGFDYAIISPGQVSFLYRTPNPHNVVFKFHNDDIAQEIRETLNVGLVQTPGSGALPTGRGVFFRNTITMTIIDNNGKRLCW